MADCACFYVEADIHPDFYNEKIRRARKEHTCCECGCTIVVGDSYEYVSGKWDGYVSTYKTCPVCVELRAKFMCYGWVFGELHTHLWEHMDNFAPDAPWTDIGQLSPPARDVMIHIIEMLWERDEE